MPFFNLLMYQLKIPGEATVRWAMAERRKNTATMIPRGRLIRVLVAGHNLPIDSSYVKKDVVIGKVKLLLKMTINIA
jgi:hypothetical protein